jgi:hypothetical protein
MGYFRIRLKYASVNRDRREIQVSSHERMFVCRVFDEKMNLRSDSEARNAFTQDEAEFTHHLHRLNRPL